MTNGGYKKDLRPDCFCTLC